MTSHKFDPYSLNFIPKLQFYLIFKFTPFPGLMTSFMIGLKVISCADRSLDENTVFVLSLFQFQNEILNTIFFLPSLCVALPNEHIRHFFLGGSPLGEGKWRQGMRSAECLLVSLWLLSGDSVIKNTTFSARPINLFSDHPHLLLNSCLNSLIKKKKLINKVATKLINIWCDL